MKDLHIPAKTKTVSVTGILIKGSVESALADELGTTVDKIKIYSISDNPSKLAYDIVYKEVTNES